jgi:hypothetical protein
VPRIAAALSAQLGLENWCIEWARVADAIYELLNPHDPTLEGLLPRNRSEPRRKRAADVKEGGKD